MLVPHSKTVTRIIRIFVSLISYSKQFVLPWLGIAASIPSLFLMIYFCLFVVRLWTLNLYAYDAYVFCFEMASQ